MRTIWSCQFETDGKQLLADLMDRLEQFGLSLHEGKTRLIEFGRLAARNRAAAGRRRPETVDFLGFTHDCGKTRTNKFVVKRKTQAKRLVRTLKATRDETQRRMHAPVREQHRWLRQVLNGHYQCFGVIFNYRSLRVVKACVVRGARRSANAATKAA
jgi:RNA-directed DNA polymerase